MAGLKASPRPLKGRCRACAYRDVCGGNTRVRAYQLTGDPWAEDPACYLGDDEIGLPEDFIREPLEPWTQAKPVRFMPTTQPSGRLGKVHLVGGGPGDPDLLTLRAHKLLQQADTVVYDRLVSPAVLSMANPKAECIYVGKADSRHALSQEEINQLLVRLARRGKRVVRLKGGDPFIFGRGGEEIEALSRAGVPFQVVPGITAASGCSAYAGIPLTHRDCAQSVIFVTGHLKDGSVELNWHALAQPRQTVVFYMGLHGIELICRELLSHGLPGATPVALIEQGTTGKQRVYAATLATLPAAAADAKPPSLIIVGEVAKLHKTLGWFEPQHAADDQPACQAL